MNGFKPSGRIIGLGSIIMDIHIKCGRFPLVGETLYTPYDYQTIPGGKGANQAVAAARLGGSVKMIGRIAADEYAKTMEQSLRQAGIDTSSLIVEEKGKSGVAFVWVNENGENQIICAPAVNMHLSKEDIEEGLALLETGDILMTTLEFSEEVLECAVCTAKEKGALVMLDPSCGDYQKLSPKLARSVDILKPNEVEAKILTGIEVKDASSAYEAVRRLKKKGITCPVVTLGSQGAVYEENDRPIYKPGIQVEAVDTTAAGDTFIGAMASRLSKGDTLSDAIEYGNLAAAICVTTIGAQTSIPYEADVRNNKNINWKK